MRENMCQEKKNLRGLLRTTDLNGFEHGLVVEPANRGVEAAISDGLAKVPPVVVLEEEEMRELR